METVPQEIFELILSFLDVRTVKIVSCVCSLWQTWCLAEGIWKLQIMTMLAKSLHLVFEGIAMRLPMELLSEAFFRLTHDNFKKYALKQLFSLQNHSNSLSEFGIVIKAAHAGIITEFYIGELRGRRYHGRGVAVYIGASHSRSTFGSEFAVAQDSLACSYSGEWKNDQHDGKGVWRVPQKHYTYSGNWEAGKRDGFGFEHFHGRHYAGNWKQGSRHGLGVWAQLPKKMLRSSEREWMRGDDGKVYKGNFQKGRICGDGVLFYPDGDLCRADWTNGCEMKYGIIWLASSMNCYKGTTRPTTEARAGSSKVIQFHGTGVYIFYNSGERYEGNFAFGKFHGAGKLVNSDGDTLLDCEWKNGLYQGQELFRFGVGGNPWLIERKV